ncbi:MAG: hypothetical protein MRY78_08385 [Saprospiraceae bacterium]|nr:hypothetical protein [Saprospiraceae bacterium]
MLGILLIYFIGKYFYDLAEAHKRSNWLFAVLGVVSYYVGAFVFSLIALMVLESASPGFIDNTNLAIFDILAIPFGILACWGFYTYLKNHWSKKILTDTRTDLLDDEMLY